MLKWSLVNNIFFRFSQTGMFIDFILKQIIEYFVRNLLVYTALFFGEKYIIEYLTKKTIDSFIFNTNSLFSNKDFSFNDFFLTIACVLFYLLCFIFLLIVIL